MNPVVVRNVRIGEGIPKICVPVTGVTKEDIIREAQSCTGIPADIVEWRADWFEHIFDMDKTMEVLERLRTVLGQTPLLFTFRTSREGGEKPMEPQAYAALNKAAARSGYTDLVDVEAFTGDGPVKDMIAAAHACGVKVIFMARRKKTILSAGCAGCRSWVRISAKLPLCREAGRMY